MQRQIDARADFVQRQAVGNQLLDRQFPAENKPRRLLLQIHRGAVAAEQRALADANIRARQSRSAPDAKSGRTAGFARPGREHRMACSTMPGRRSRHDHQVRAAALGQLAPPRRPRSGRPRVPGLLAPRSGSARSRRRAIVSVATTRAPVRRTSMVNISPIGPWPRMTSTVRPAAGRICTTAFRQVLTGSTKLARSNGTPVGNLLHAALRQSSPSPGRTARSRRRRVRNPAVTPTFL